MPAAGLVSPDNFSIRDPRDKAMQNGRISNPPRYTEVGGLNGPNVWFRESTPSGSEQSSQDNKYRVEKPTSVKSAHKSGREND